MHTEKKKNKVKVPMPVWQVAWAQDEVVAPCSLRSSVTLWRIQVTRFIDTEAGSSGSNT